MSILISLLTINMMPVGKIWLQNFDEAFSPEEVEKLAIQALSAWPFRQYYRTINGTPGQS